MTDKQIIIDGVDVSGCAWCDYEPDSEPYCRINDGEDLGCQENPNCYYKQLKRKEQECESLRNLLVEQNDVMKINELMMKEFGIEILKDITTDDITLRSIKLIELKQECEELKNIINEAQNSKLDLKSFLVGEAIQKEYEVQLDQLKGQLEAYKMEAEEGKEINAELKAENEKLKGKNKFWEDYCKINNPNLHKIILRDIKLRETLTEIKEIVIKPIKIETVFNINNWVEIKRKILQKISEVIDDKTT